MALRAKIGAGLWDMLFCEACDAAWSGMDVDLEWTDDPEHGETHCPRCGSMHVIREERG